MGWFKQTAATCLLLGALVGCGSFSNDRYIPAPPIAREALTAAMESWLRGEQGTQSPGGQPRIELIDSQRKARKLEHYEILGELSVEGGRRFDVRLHLKDPDEIETVQYIVLGIDPLWVMQKRDYDTVTHWEMDMHKPQAEDSSKEQAIEEKLNE